jgi:hypothetical protein
MADFPATLIQAFGTEVFADSGTEVDRSVSGKPRLRSYFTQIRKTITLLLDVDDAGMTAIDDHYAAEQFSAFTFTYKADNSAYTVRYSKAPAAKPTPGNRWSVTVDFVEV